MNTHILTLLLFLVTTTCFAQTDCKPTLKFSSGTQELGPSVHHDEAHPFIWVTVQPKPNCQNGISYEVLRGMAYVIKNNKLVDEIRLKGGSAHLTHWVYRLQAGDRISFRITHLYAINAKGEKRPVTASLTGSIDVK